MIIPLTTGLMSGPGGGWRPIWPSTPPFRWCWTSTGTPWWGSDGTIYKPMIQIDGVKMAQVMLLVGSDDAGASFPDWTEHLALAMEIQQEMNSLWPGLARPITLRTARFNQQLTKGSLLVEVGGHGNSLEEALAGARLFARSAAKVLLERVQ